MKSRGAFDAEFVQIKEESASSKATFEASSEQYNIRKNRYMNVRPIDSSRVKLTHSGVLGGDYINANYVDGWKSEHAYIATQAPVPGTIHDFWRMVWEENCSVIVMVTNEIEQGKLKAHKYWPDEGGKIQCGTLEVIFKDYDSTRPDITVRKLVLRSSLYNETREILQFQMKTWPDQGVPDKTEDFHSLIHTVRGAAEDGMARGQNGPIVVHCSAGIGRSGTFIAVDISLRRLAAVGNIDMMSTVNYMRTLRAGSVQTIAQYRFCYEAIKQYVEANGTSPIVSPLAIVPSAVLTQVETSQLHMLAGADDNATKEQLLSELQQLV